MRTAYNFFSRDYFNSLKEGYSTHDSIRDAASIWKDLPEEKRNEYQKRSDLDRIRYDEELKKYSTRFKKYGLPSMNGKRGDVKKSGVICRTTSILISLYYYK